MRLDQRLLALIAAGVLLAATPALKLGVTTLDAMARESGAVVIATVRSVEELTEGKRVANAAVEHVWKGKPGAEVSFRAHPVFACDQSTAIAGERVVLFLTDPDEEGMRHIASSGRGRLPIHVIDGEVLAQICGVKLPKRSRPKKDVFSHGVGLELGTVEKHVIKAVQQQEKERREQQAEG